MPSYEYLTGKAINGFEEKLPRGIDIVRYYFHFQNMSEKEKISEITDQIQRLYNRIGIPIIHFESIRSKLKRLVAPVKSIVETRKSEGPAQKKKELSLLHKLNQMFEVIENGAALSAIKNDFITDQRTVRQRFINADLLESIQTEPSTSYQQATNQIFSTESEISHQDSWPEAMDFDNSPDFALSEQGDDWPETRDFDDSPDFEPPGEKGRKKINLCEDDMKELSKCGGSYRVIEKALSIGIKAAGGNPKDFALSKSSLCEQMSAFRSSNKSDVLAEISASDEKVVIHFDSKKFPKINQKHVGQDSRMVAVCHTRTRNVPLGLPILESGSATSYVNELIGLCENYNLKQRVVGLLCDTVITNMGESGGVCALFEDEMNFDVLCLTCRHHILEVLLSSAFTATLGVIEAPKIIIFDQLKVEWPNIKAHRYQYNPCDPNLLQSFLLKPFYDNAKNILVDHAKNKFIRDDYAELTDLCLKFIGVKTEKTFMAPGAMSKSRWMAKAIYAIKTYLFRAELGLDAEFESNLLELSLFVALIYCKYWNRCVNAINAPVNDLALIAELERYSDYNAMIADAVWTSFQNHLWYLGEELVILALFSENVSNDDKNRMRQKLDTGEYPGRSENSIRLKSYIHGTGLPELVTKRSLFMLSILELDTNFLHENAESWEHNRSYKKAEKFIKNMIPVVNDAAEAALGRATTIMQNQRARSESRFQNMFISLYK